MEVVDKVTATLHLNMPLYPDPRKITASTAPHTTTTVSRDKRSPWEIYNEKAALFDRETLKD